MIAGFFKPKKPTKQFSDDDLLATTEAAFLASIEASVIAAADAVTPAAIAEREAAERAAAKSRKQRGRPLVRDAQISMRIEGWMKEAMTSYAGAHGGRTMADGFHLIMERMVELGEIQKGE